MKSKFVGIDFDGTCVTHEYPAIGKPVDNCLDVLYQLQDAGHKLILYTMRSGERLAQAVEYLEENGVRLYSVNENPTQHHWTASRKVFCHLYIDDAALGCPIEQLESGRPVVDWYEVESLLQDGGYI